MSEVEQYPDHPSHPDGPPQPAPHSLWTRMAEALQRWQLPVATVVLAAMLLPRLGSAGLLDPWEMDRAAVARRMAAAPRVLVVEAGGGSVVGDLDKQAAGRYTVLRANPKNEGTALTALQLTAPRLTREVAHALVVDVDAAHQPGRGWEELATPLATIESQNKGMALVLVTAGDAKPLAEALAKARGRQLGATHRNPNTVGWLDKESDGEGVWPLLAGREIITQRAGLLAALDQGCPSPWSLPVHKRDADNVAVPWLEAAVAASGFALFGVTEFAARIGAALTMLLTGLLAVIAARRLWGNRAGWLTLFAFATLPEVVGLGRVLSFEVTPVLGTALVALGLAQGAARVSRTWLLWFFMGCAVLLLGRGLAGLTIATAVAVSYLLATADLRASTVTAALGSGALLAGAAAVILGDTDHVLLRGLRFTQGAFSVGPDQFHRDFAWFVGQAGFGLFPWGAAVAIGLGRMLTQDADRDLGRFRTAAALLAGLVVPFVVMALLVRQYNHLVVPVAAVAALAAAAMLDDLLAGRLTGRLLGAFVVLSTLLLHREIGKGADALTRFFAFDPPVAGAGGTGPLVWPAELTMHKALMALVLLAVVAFALGIARPFDTVRRAVDQLRRPRLAAWTLGALATAWALDALISLGTKLDVMLKTQAQTTGYNYDRIWVQIQDTRPEVIAPAVGFALLLVLAAVASTDRGLSGRPWGKILIQISGLLRAPVVLAVVMVIGMVAVLGSGVSKFAQLQAESGIGGAIGAGLRSSSLAGAVALLLLAAFARTRASALEGSGSLLEPLAVGTRNHFGKIALSLGLWALASIGVGASQVAGTWSFPLYLIGIWWLVIAAVLAVVAHSEDRPGGYGWAAAALGFVAVVALFGPLAARYVAETQPVSDAYKYLLRVLIASGDAAGLVVLFALVAVNRWADGRERLRDRIDAAVGLAQRVEQPHWAASAMVLAGLVFTVGYAWALLPSLSLHFSQKHLVQKVESAGGAAADDRGQPRTFAHGGSQSGSDNNFYTQTMPLIEDRQAVLGLLAGDNVATRVVDNSQGGATRVVALPGWDAALDANKDGKRDLPAWFGVVTSADDKTVRVANAGWQPGAWQGAAVWAPGQQSATVVDNTADSLTLSAPLALSADDGVKGWIAIDKAPTAATEAPTASWRHAAAQAVQRFVVLPKDVFSEVNHAFRQAHQGQQIPVLDAASSRLVLAANVLQAGQDDQNWIKKALITPEDMAKDKNIRKIFVNFDNTIHLIGYKLAEAAVSRSQKYKLTFYWKVVKATPTSWKIFMHPHPLHLDRWPLTDPDPSEDENKPCNGCFQTNHWMPGDIIADTFEQEVPLGTNAGPNEIILGWYNPSSDTRLPVIAATGPGVIKHGDNRATIGHLQVR